MLAEDRRQVLGRYRMIRRGDIRDSDKAGLSYVGRTRTLIGDIEGWPS